MEDSPEERTVLVRNVLKDAAKVIVAQLRNRGESEKKTFRSNP